MLTSLAWHFRCLAKISEPESLQIYVTANQELFRDKHKHDTDAGAAGHDDETTHCEPLRNAKTKMAWEGCRPQKRQSPTNHRPRRTCSLEYLIHIMLVLFSYIVHLHALLIN